MATNKDPWLRYLALDKCLSNYSRKFYIEDLQKAVCDYLTREKSEETTVSKRQIYDDLSQMRTSPELNAPIESYWEGQRKYYRYSEPGFSIVDLTDEELSSLEATVNMLASFWGMPQFDWMSRIIDKLKKKYKVSYTFRNILSFDSNVDLQGIERFQELFGYVNNEQPIIIEYAPFGKTPFRATVHPYCLKQYNNRWYLLGLVSDKEYHDISVFALDRITNVTTSDSKFIPDTIMIDPEDYFYDVIGMTINKEAKKEKVVLRFAPCRYSFVTSKPIHPSQTKNDQERTITINVIPNRELTATILGFGKDVEVLEPQSLRLEIASIFEECCKNYGLVKNDCTNPQ